MPHAPWVVLSGSSTELLVADFLYSISITQDLSIELQFFLFVTVLASLQGMGTVWLLNLLFIRDGESKRVHPLP